MSLLCLVFIIDCTRSDRSLQFNIVFGIDRTCTICHIIVLSGFFHRVHHVQLVTTVHYHFRHRPHLYDRSRHCPIWFSSHIAPDQINIDSLVLILVYTKFIWSFMLLSQLVFIIDHTRSNWSWHFSFVFSVDHICKIIHIVSLSGFCHTQHLIWSVMIV